MSIVVFIIFMIYIFFIINTIRKAKNRVDGNYDVYDFLDKKSVSDDVRKKQIQYRRNENRRLVSSLEDRNNDWLSSQIAHERLMSVKVNEMFGIRSKYLDSEDSRKLRQEHHVVCESRHDMDV